MHAILCSFMRSNLREAERRWFLSPCWFPQDMEEVTWWSESSSNIHRWAPVILILPPPSVANPGPHLVLSLSPSLKGHSTTFLGVLTHIHRKLHRRWRKQMRPPQAPGLRHPPSSLCPHHPESLGGGGAEMLPQEACQAHSYHLDLSLVRSLGDDDTILILI